MKTFLRSFAAGEIAPELHGRLDLNKRQTGVALALNFDVLPHGPLARSPGWEYVLEAKDSSRPVRILPFEFSVDQALVIELGHNYARFHTPAGTVLETAKAIVAVPNTSPAIFEITSHGYAIGDWIFLTGMLGMTTFNGGFYKVYTVPDANRVELVRLDGSALNAGSLPAYTGSGTASRVYTIASGYDSAKLFDLHYSQSNDVFTIVHPDYPAAELRRLGAANWTKADIVFAPGIAAPTGVGIVATMPTATNPIEYGYGVTTVAADGVSESFLSLTVGDLNNLSIFGNYNTISWSAVTGASRYRVYKYRGGIYGYIGSTTGLSLIDDNIEADTATTHPENYITLNTGANEYPAAVTYHEQRRWFAGTNNKPQGVWATRSGTETNLTSSAPNQDGDGMAFRVASRQQNRIRHLVALSDLAVLTNAAEWRLFADNAPAITPTTLTVKPSGYAGASNVQPVVTSGSILYVQGQGSYIRELSYGGAEANYNYRTIDLSVMAPHLFDGKAIVDLAYSRAPDQRLWAVRSDGILLGMTYVPEQQVYAWHQHNTQGLFKSVAVIPADSEDTLFAAVEREIDGRTVTYIEKRRQRHRSEDDIVDAFFVDAGLVYEGTAATTISGLWHLEGQEVTGLADGAVFTATVTDGSITLETAATKVIVGLRRVARAKTLPLAVEATEANGQGLLGNINEAVLRVESTPYVRVGRDFDNMRETASRSMDDLMDSPPGERTGQVQITVDGAWDYDAALCIEQRDPVPCTISAMTLEVEFGG